jgi:hypothetical protein
MLWNEENIALWSSQILCIFVLRAVKITTFRSKMVVFPARNANIYKICELHRAIFSSFYNISQPNVAILRLILRYLSSYGDGFRSSCLDQNFVCSWKHPLGINSSRSFLPRPWVQWNFQLCWQNSRRVPSSLRVHWPGKIVEINHQTLINIVKGNFLALCRTFFASSIYWNAITFTE